MNTFSIQSSKAHQRAFAVAATAFSAEYLQFVQNELNAAIAAGETAREFSDRLLARQPVPWKETWPVEPVKAPSRLWTKGRLAFFGAYVTLMMVNAVATLSLYGSKLLTVLVCCSMSAMLFGWVVATRRESLEQSNDANKHADDRP